MSEGPIVIRAARWVDIAAGEVRAPAVVVVEDDRVTAVNPTRCPPVPRRSTSATPRCSPA